MQSNNYKTLSSKILKENFTDLRIGTRLNEGTGLTCSTKFIAFANDGGGGSGSIISLESAGIRKPPIMMISGHSAGITDMKFSPFYNNFLATSSDDRSIKTWKLPNNGEFFDILKSDIMDSQNIKRGEYVEKINSPISSLHGHEKRVTLIEFNRNANNILSSTSSDGEMVIWDLEKSLKIFSYTESNNLCYDMKWNYYGNLLATTNKDRLVRIVDPREQSTVFNFNAHEGTRIGKCTWLGGFGTIQNKLITTGFTRTGSRSVKLWDVRSTETPIIDVQLDIMSSTLYPHFEDEFRLLTVYGKGDGNIRVFKFDNEEDSLIQIEEVRTAKPQRGVCFLPTRCLDVTKSEVIRIFKTVNTDTIDIISLCLPRKQHIFSEELFPDCYAGIPSCNSNEWREGINRAPVLVTMNPDSEKKPYIPDEEEFNLKQPTKKITSILRKTSSIKTNDSNLNRSNTLSKQFSIGSNKSINLFNELPQNEEIENEFDESLHKSKSSRKSSRSNSILSKLATFMSFGKRGSSSVKFSSKKLNSNELGSIIEDNHDTQDYVSEKNSIQESTVSSYYNTNLNIIDSNVPFCSKPDSICKNISNNNKCNLFEDEKIDYSDILDYKAEYSGNTSLVELPACHFNLNNINISDLPCKLGSKDGCNYLNNTNNIGFVKKMVESINSANCASFNLEKSCNQARLCKINKLQKSFSNFSLESEVEKDSIVSKSSSVDFDVLSSSIINKLRRDLEDANKRITQLDNALKSTILPSRQKTLKDKQEIQNKSSELQQLREQIAKLNIEYYDLNTAYRQQSALFGLYKEFYGELEDILAESFSGMKRIAAGKK